MRIRQIAAAGTAAAALMLGAALPASANSHVSVAAAQAKAKAAKKVEVFQDANFRNRRTHFTKNQPNLKDVGWNDTISSAINQGRRTVTFYTDAYYHGASLSLAPGGKIAHFGDHKHMSDATSSIKFR
ncbi:peptidase inhibitor family I36 protein [Streptomyces lydicus]|uniref:peptidase inhibitor family I36 protein n=1 Tax=Streptomyces lydicus TaxID=47763 RepID=UPI003795506B